MTMDNETSQEFANVRATYRRNRKRGAYFWVIAAAYMIVSPAIAILVSRQIAIDSLHQSEQKLCAIVVTSDQNYKTNPPQSKVLQQQAANMARLRQQYHCDREKK